jgi:hypothetical protein
MNRTTIKLLGIFLACGSVYCLVHRSSDPVVNFNAVVPMKTGSSRPVEPTDPSTNAAVFSATIPGPALRNDVVADPAPTNHPPAWEPGAGQATNADLALAAALKLPEGDARNRALAAVCFSVAQNNPANAVTLAQALHLDEQTGAVMENLVQQWAVSDPASALGWTFQQPADDRRDALMTRVAYALSQTDPARAASLVTDQISPGTAQDEAVMMVVNQWGNQNLAAAATWVETFPEGPLQKRAVEELEGIQQYQQQLARQ